MAELATEGGDVKLDWVDQLAWLLENRDAIATVERLASDLREAGFRRLVWAGMGGSVQTIHSLVALGLFDEGPIRVHPLDSTDPAALNRLLDEISDGEGLDAALARTALVAVAMGMTSEEPITHLTWFDGLLRERGVADPAGHVVVMALPGSFLDRFATQQGARRLSIQPNGESHVAGRMSAPSTHVFLLPAALAAGPGQLAALVERAQSEIALRPGMTAEERARFVAEDPFVRLAAWLHQQLGQGRNMLLLDSAPSARGLEPWVEQVVEESLGKGGRGLLVFPGQDLDAAAAWPDRFALLRVDGGAGTAIGGRPLASLTIGQDGTPAERLAALARFFAGWDLTVAVLGYLQGIVFAGQPAVEGYKRYARELRDRQGPLPYPERDLIGDDGLTLALGSLAAAGLNSATIRERADTFGAGPAAALAATIALLREQGRLGYLDVTLNADPAGSLWNTLGEAARDLGNRILHVPVKVRSGPRDYHSTEQSETDGPPDLLSLRILVRESEPVAAGIYSDRFLHAQALGTVAAMADATRPVLLAILDRRSDPQPVADLFRDAAGFLGRY